MLKIEEALIKQDEDFTKEIVRLAKQRRELTTQILQQRATATTTTASGSN